MSMEVVAGIAIVAFVVFLGWRVISAKDKTPTNGGGGTNPNDGKYPNKKPN